jgi:vanillate O-demethylase monooxygenase subunit
MVETPMSGSLTSGGLHPTDPGAVRIDKTLIQAAADGSSAVVSISYNPSEIDCGEQLENFTDFGHFPWVHPGLLGDPERPVVPDYAVRTDGHVLRYDIVRPEAPNSDDFPVFANEAVAAAERRSSYRLHLPYTIVLRLGWGGHAAMVYVFASQPIAEDRCAGYVVIGRNYDPDQPPEVLQEFERTIFEQIGVVESQRPERVPFDLAAEMHLKFDAVAINYRRAMREQGLARRAQPRSGADR